MIIKIDGDGKEGRLKRQSTQSERHLKSIATRVSNIKADIVCESSSDALLTICDIVCNYYTNETGKDYKK